MIFFTSWRKAVEEWKKAAHDWAQLAEDQASLIKRQKEFLDEVLRERNYYRLCLEAIGGDQKYVTIHQARAFAQVALSGRFGPASEGKTIFAEFERKQ